MEYSYLITPFIAWLIAGISKFLVNSYKAKQLAFGLIGYGGLPSNHSAIVSSTATLIALREGINHPAFGVAVTVAFVVMLDANSLRRQIGNQASTINQLSKDKGYGVLRERIGHTKIEIAAGILVGYFTALLVYTLL